MTDDDGQQPEGQASPTGERPDLGYVPGQPFPPPGQAYPPPGWPQQPVQPMYPVYVKPDLPKATAAMVVGIVAIAGSFVLCGLPLLISPVAWVLGAQARRQIREAPQQWDGESKATAGLVLGIIGTILLVLVLIVLIVVIVVAINDPNAFESDTGV